MGRTTVSGVMPSNTRSQNCPIRAGAQVFAVDDGPEVAHGSLHGKLFDVLLPWGGFAGATLLMHHSYLGCMAGINPSACWGRSMQQHRDSAGGIVIDNMRMCEKSRVAFGILSPVGFHHVRKDFVQCISGTHRTGRYNVAPASPTRDVTNKAFMSATFQGWSLLTL